MVEGERLRGEESRSTRSDQIRSDQIRSDQQTAIRNSCLCQANQRSGRQQQELCTFPLPLAAVSSQSVCVRVTGQSRRHRHQATSRLFTGKQSVPHTTTAPHQTAATRWQPSTPAATVITLTRFPFRGRR